MISESFEDASAEEIFEDSETPVFSVNLEKAAFTAKRCNLPSSHEWDGWREEGGGGKGTHGVFAVKPHRFERARPWCRSYRDLSYQFFPAHVGALSRGQQPAVSGHVRGILRSHLVTDYS